MAQAGRHSEVARGRGIDPDRVLAGQVIPSERDLIALIHDVNPTGRELDKREAARRYAIKTRLQSLLVLRFPDDMEVVPDDKPGVVLLRHKYLGLAASHAIVADLQEEARAWVQMQLDLGTVEQAWVLTPPELERRQRERGHRRKGHRDRPRDRFMVRPDDDAPGADEMVAALREGRLAQASYDYEEAREAFQRAHRLAPEAPAPLAALLDLLVNQLGLDREALDLAQSAPVAALHSPAVFASMALAAARLGERERAEAWCRHVEGARAAEVLRILATTAIRAGELGYATKTLGRARQCLPVDPERIAVEVQLDRARAAAVAEDEARLAVLWGEGNAPAAAELAHRIVEQYPGSAPARAILKEAAALERRVRCEQMLDEARAAALRSRFKQARKAWATARDWGADPAKLAEVLGGIAAGEARAAQIARDKRLERVGARLCCPGLAASERKAALVAYLGFDRQDRDSVRQRCPAEELAWLDELPPALPALRCEPIAAAVHAARAAVGLLDAGDSDGAQTLLAAHRTILGEHGFGRPILARLDLALQARQQARALTALDKAEEALREKDLDAAKDLLDSVARDRLPVASQGVWDRLSRALASARQYRACMELVEERLAKRRPILARQLLLERLMETADEEERTSLRERLARVDDAVRDEHLGIDCVPPSGYLAREAPEMVTNYAVARGVDTMLLPGGRTVALVSAGQLQCAVRLVDVDSGETQRFLAWCLMEAMAPSSLGISDQRLWLEDAFFNYAEIDCQSWLPCRQSNLKLNGDPADMVDRCVSIPAADVVWLKTQPLLPPYTSRLRAVNVAQGRLIDLRNREGDPYLIPGTPHPLVAWFAGPGRGLCLMSARGQAEAYIDMADSEVALGVAVAPAGQGYVVLIENSGAAEPWLDLLLVGVLGTRLSRLRLSIEHVGAVGVATILPKRLVCVSYAQRNSGQPRLAYVREPNPGDLMLAADVEAPGLLGITQDPAASTAVAVCRSAHGVRLTRLDGMPTAFPAVYDEILLPRLFRFVDCAPVPEPEIESRFRSDPYLDENHREFADSNLERLARGIERSRRALSLYRQLRLRGMHGRADRLLEFLEQQKTDNFLVRLALAEREALEGRWVGDDLEREAASAGVSDHLLHMRAVAYLHQGDLGRVIETLAGRAAHGPCRLDALLTLVRELEAERAGEPMRPAEMARPSLASLIRSIFAFDRARARGELDESLRILDQAWIRAATEGQSAARLADLYLAVKREDPPVQRFKASTLLADFADHRYACARARTLWLGESTWSLDRLAKLDEQAHYWLYDLTWKTP